jgi:hypothetical protein
MSFNGRASPGALSFLLILYSLTTVRDVDVLHGHNLLLTGPYPLLG